MLLKTILPSAMLLVLASGALHAQASKHVDEQPTDLSFVAGAATVVREKPEIGAKAIRTLQPFDVVMVYDAEPGWLHVDLLANSGPSAGWIRATNNVDIIPVSWLDLRMKVQAMKPKPWSQGVKLDILRGRPRVGFTKEQVELALGRPIAVRTTETAKGTQERWAYVGRTVTFTGDRASVIEQTATP